MCQPTGLVLQYDRKGKNGDAIVDSSQAKSTIQTGNLCYYNVNVNVLVLMVACEQALSGVGARRREKWTEILSPFSPPSRPHPERIGPKVMLMVCRIRGAQSLVTLVTSKRSIQPHHQHKRYIQQCMLGQDTLTVLQVQHILGDKTGSLRGQDPQPKSLASHADHFRSIFVPPSCDLGFELVPSNLNITSVVAVNVTLLLTFIIIHSVSFNS